MLLVLQLFGHKLEYQTDWNFDLRANCQNSIELHLDQRFCVSVFLSFTPHTLYILYCNSKDLNLQHFLVSQLRCSTKAKKQKHDNDF